MGQIFSRQLQRRIVHIRPHAESYIFQRHIIGRRFILPQNIVSYRQADYLGISCRYLRHAAALGIGIHAAFLGKLCRLLPFRIKYAELRASKLYSLLVHLFELYSGFVVSRSERHFRSDRSMACYFYRVGLGIQGIAHRRRDLGYTVCAGSRHLHRNGTVRAGFGFRVETVAPHGKPRVGKRFISFNVPLDNAQGVATLCVLYGNSYILNVGNLSVLILLRYVKRTLRIVPFVPLRRTALYRHIAAVGYAGFNGFAAAIGYQRNWIFPGLILRGVYFKLRSEQGVPSLIGLFYGQRAGLGRIFHGYGVAPVRRDLEGYKLLVRLIALRRRRLLQEIFAQRQRYRAGAAVQSGYRLAIYGLLILIQHLKYRAAQGFAPVGAYLFNGKLLLRPGIGPYSRNAAYVFAFRHSAADAHIIRVVAAHIALRRYYLRKLIHAIRHVLKADPPLIFGNGIHLLNGGIRRAAFLYKIQLEHRPCEAIARAVGFGEFDLSLFAPVFQLKLNRFVMVFGVHLNDLIFYSHHALWGICFVEIVCAPEQTANEYLATFICNKLGAGTRKAGIGIFAAASTRRNKPACAVFQRKLYSFQQLAVFVSLDYFQACIYLRVIYANPCFVIFNLEVLARRYDDITFRRLYFFQKVFAQGKVFEGKGAVTAGSKYSRIIFIGKGNEVCSVGRYILLLGVPDYKLRAGKLCLSVFGKLCDDKLGMFVFYGFKLYNSLRTIRTVNRHLYRGCLNIPLRCFDLGNCILSKRKPCKFHHTILPAFSRHRDDASAADGKLNTREQFPIVALLRQFERVLL